MNDWVAWFVSGGSSTILFWFWVKTDQAELSHLTTLLFILALFYFVAMTILLIITRTPMVFAALKRSVLVAK